ncbi:hypothetical protein MRB53_038165 [Persea americana]|nr:hypothetical protein MRB53_038165 [Persea americana]
MCVGSMMRGRGCSNAVVSADWLRLERGRTRRRAFEGGDGDVGYQGAQSMGQSDNLLLLHRHSPFDFDTSDQPVTTVRTINKKASWILAAHSSAGDLAMANAKPKHTFIVEHLDPELEEWQALEYNAISTECAQTGSAFLLSGLTTTFESFPQLQIPVSERSQRTVESLYPSREEKQRICLLDPKAEKDISPGDADAFDVFLFGGILGDDPPRDRTGDLRKLGFPGRRLGPEQMTTDTAARVTRIVVQQQREYCPCASRNGVEAQASVQSAY